MVPAARRHLIIGTNIALIANVWIQMVKPVTLDQHKAAVVQSMPKMTTVMTTITMQTVIGTMVPAVRRHLIIGTNIALIANVWIQMVMPMMTIVMTIITMETVTGTMVPVAIRHLKSGMNIALIANVWIQMVKPKPKSSITSTSIEVVQTMQMMTILITITMLTAIGTTVPDSISQ